MNLVKTSILTFIATAVRLSVAFIINKVLSIYAGPSGLAVMGQFQNILQIALTASTGAINVGVTKYVSEYEHELDSKKEIVAASLKISIVSSICTSILLLLFSNEISTHALGNAEYSNIILIFGCSIFLFSLNQLTLAILNGERKIQLYTKINILQSVISLLLSLVLVYFYQLYGALLALTINQSLVFILILKVVLKEKVYSLSLLKKRLNSSPYRKLLKYSSMAMTTAIISPLVLMLIRDYISEELTLDYAGYWQGMYFLSATYLSLITTSLATYFLPKLSACKKNHDISREIKGGLFLVVPLLIVMTCLIYSFKELVVGIVFTPEFLPMVALFKFQLIGDVFKVISWFFSYLMLAKSLTKYYIFSEVFFSLTLLFLMKSFISENGLIGASYAYAVNYFCYMLATIYLTRSFWMVKK